MINKKPRKNVKNIGVSKTYVRFETKENIVKDYDREFDTLFVNYGKVKSSIELFNGELFLDLNKKGEVVGFEIMNFKKHLGGKTI